MQILVLKIQGKTLLKPPSSNSYQLSLFSFPKRDLTSSLLIDNGEGTSSRDKGKISLLLHLHL